MLVNYKHLGLEEKYGVSINLITLPFEDIVPSVASASAGADIGFGSFIGYLNQYKNLNTDSDDPVLFVYPAYVFKGGGFVTFDKGIKPLRETGVVSQYASDILQNEKFGYPDKSIYELVLAHVARSNDVPLSEIDTHKIVIEDGLLAAQSGALDIAAAGLTQLNETKRRGGEIVFTMDDVGFADITGFLVKESTMRERGDDVRAVIQMWFECVAYVMSDIEGNSRETIDYLDRQAATKYTIDEFKAAIEQEYFPTTTAEAYNETMTEEGKFSHQGIQETVIAFFGLSETIQITPLPPGSFKTP
ncbi:hypothetical protein [Haloferula helveola]